MNKVILMGRLTSDPKMDWTRSEDSKQYATYTLAVNRRFKKNGQADADFISCIAWGAMAEFAEKLVRENAELGTVLAKSLQGALPAIALDGHPALSTAYMNDCEPLLCFAQQVNGYGKTGDVFLGISTSGNSKNVLYAATTAHAKGMKVIGLTGAKNSKLEQMSDVCIKVPQTETYMIQELHLPVYHCLCLMLEERFFGENN